MIDVMQTTKHRLPDDLLVAERLIGSIRRECLDHVIVFGEDHLRRILKHYADYQIGCELTSLWTRTRRSHASCIAPGLSRHVQPSAASIIIMFGHDFW